MQRHPSPDPLDDLDAPAVRTLVVGEDPLVRESVAQRVRGTPLEAASSGAVEAAARAGADVVLWDLGPSVDELAHAAAGAPRFSELHAPVIALAPDRCEALPLLAAGASAVLRRDVSAEALRSAVDSVRLGLCVVEPSLLNLPAPASEPLPARAAAEVTPREHDVLELMAVGLSNKQIAAKLGISSHTAKFHIGAILAKMNAATRTEAVVRAVQRGIIVV